MLRRLIGAGLLTLSVSLLLAPSFAQESSKQKPQPTGKLYSIGVFAGKILDVREDGQSFRLQVQGKTPVPKFTPGNPRS